MVKEIEKRIEEDLYNFLRSQDRVDEKLPECPDVEELWPQVEEAYVPDGVREFQEYPVASLGWIMFVGMAFAKYWDEDWVAYANVGGKKLYEDLRDVEGYDKLDDTVLYKVLGLDEKEADAMIALVGECAQRVLHTLQTCGVEPGSKDAALLYVDSLHILYLFGMRMELNALGYHMTKMG
ncbi:MAG: hypothetical protein K2N88_02690 [Muribaculaceae bacterium]|nr:hypothetical protein [Muribaculaceae bacterium]